MADNRFRLGVITGTHAPTLSDDDELLVAALADRGVEAVPVRWDDATVAWTEYDGVLFRSCWEYPTDPERFRGLLTELERVEVPVCNPLRAVRWNMHKSYPLDLAEAGVRLPPTTVVEAGSDVSLAEVLDRHGLREAVVKPGIGSFSRDVRRVSRDDLHDTATGFQELLSSGDVVVQRFVPEITEGERSIVFFAGTYSHAWNSLTANDDVTQFDGVDTGYDPPPAIREHASSVLDAARDRLGADPASLPYARVDYVHREGALLLIELELIEPFLGLDRGTNAADRFADALTAYYANC